MENLSRVSVAWLLSMRTISSMDNRTDIPRNPDNTYNARDVVAHVMDLERRKKLHPTTDEDSALEAKRRLEAQKIQLQILEMRKKVVPVSQTTDLFNCFTSRMRQLGETLQRQYGPDALALLNEAILDAERNVGRWHEQLAMNDDLLG